MGSFELLQVQDHSSWKAVHLEAKAKPGKYPCRRGTFLPFGGHEVLLWTQGDVKGSVTEQHYFKEGKGIPAPLLLRRFAGHGGWRATCRAVLSLTKMNWNNDSLYDRLPVTLAYAGVLARTVKRLPGFGTRRISCAFSCKSATPARTLAPRGESTRCLIAGRIGEWDRARGGGGGWLAVDPSGGGSAFFAGSLEEEEGAEELAVDADGGEGLGGLLDEGGGYRSAVLLQPDGGEIEGREGGLVAELGFLEALHRLRQSSGGTVEFP